jgi:hypothetical protein
MADPIAVIIRFSGDPDDLLERFEQARQAWIEAQDGRRATSLLRGLQTDVGIGIVGRCESAAPHRPVGQRLHPHIGAVGMDAPDQIERLRVVKLGWH